MPAQTRRALEIVELTRHDAAACERVARTLPEWFGIEEAFAESMEITWMAVAAGHHREGLGRALIDAVLLSRRWLPPLTVPSELWSPANPCLLMVRTMC